MDEISRPTVVIADDDPQVRDMYSSILEDTYEVLAVESGSRALEIIDEDADAILLDRRMRDIPGEDVLAEIREAGYDMPVAMVSGVEPDFDVLGMGFDDYLVKPVQPDGLRNLVDSLVIRREYEDVIREYFALISKVTALRQAKTAESLEANDSYLRSEKQLQEIKRQARLALDTAIEAGEFDELFKEFATDRLDEHSSMGSKSRAASSH